MATTATPQDDVAAKDTGPAKDQAAPKSAGTQIAGTGPARQAKPERKATADSKPEAKDSKAGGERPAGVFGSLTGLRTEINHLFDGFISGVGRAPTLFRSYESAWRLSRRRMPAPAVDMIEDDKAITLTAELPGLGEDNIELVLREGMLTLRGEKRSEREERTDAYSLSERHYGAFERSFRVPDNANVDKITATFEKGVLTVVVPRKIEAKTPDKDRKIRIEAK